MTITITMFQLHNVTKGGVPRTKTFEDLARYYNKCKKGGKLGSAFVRGELKYLEREDKYAIDSQLIIIDGDKSEDGSNAPSPKSVSLALKELGLNHFIYTSHSHNGDVNKFRCVIESEVYLPKDLDINNTVILRKLSKEGISIYNVQEMGAWSQLWFDPRRDDPEDGLFEYYSYFEGSKWEVIEGEEKESSESESSYDSQEAEGNGTVTDDEFDEAMESGSGINPAIVGLSQRFIYEGCSREFALRQMVRFLKGSNLPSRPERYEELIQHGTHTEELKRIVYGAKDKVSDFNSDDLIGLKTEGGKFKAEAPPKAHGLFGKFVEETKMAMQYQDDIFAFVISSFIVSSICGRKFNVDLYSNNTKMPGKPTALNMYYTLAAETGVGKDEITTATDRCRFQFSGKTGAISDFFYKGRITGPKGLFSLYKDNRAFGIIASESGANSQSALGDKQGLLTTWLGLYSQGGHNQTTAATTMSDEANNIKSCKAVSISRCCESTPVELKRYYKQGNVVENGLVPRESIFLITDLVLKVNRSPLLVHSKEIEERFVDLVSVCAKDNKEGELFQTHIISVDDEILKNEMIDTQEKYRRMQKEAPAIYERAMASRIFVKMLRFAGLITVFNKTKDDPRAKLIDRKDWEWAKAVVECEFRNMAGVISLTSGDDVMDELVNIVSGKAVAMLKGEVKNNDGKLEKGYRDAGVIPPSKLKKMCRGNPRFKDIEGDPKYAGVYKSGVDKTIEYMCKSGLFEKLESNPLGRGSALKVTELLIDNVKESNVK